MLLMPKQNEYVMSKSPHSSVAHNALTTHHRSLLGRRLKGKGKGVLGARETRGVREEGRRETPARRPLFFAFLTSTGKMFKS